MWQAFRDILLVTINRQLGGEAGNGVSPREVKGVYEVQPPSENEMVLWTEREHLRTVSLYKCTPN